ncbi:MAG TPA: hypothetical protein VF755_12505 [Catenuloplanes sp.]|jgi:hypothetical protein
MAIGATLVAGSALVFPTPALAADCPSFGNRFTKLTGDWDGDGVDTPVLVDEESRWAMRNSNAGGGPDLCFAYGTRGDIPVVGDWDGDGIDTVGVVRPSADWRQFVWHLRNSNTGGGGDVSFVYGPRIGTSALIAINTPVTGDWDGDGDTNIGVVEYTETSLRWHLRNTNSAGADSRVFNYGVARYSGSPIAFRNDDVPVVGDWDGNGTDTIGVVQPLDANNNWALRNSNTAGAANVAFAFGDSRPALTGDWDGNGIDTPGYVWLNNLGVDANGMTNYSVRWELRNANSAGGAHVRFAYGRELWDLRPPR